MVLSVKIQLPAHRAVKTTLMRRCIQRFQRAIASRRQITRHAAHTKAISAVWCYRNFNHGIVKPGIGRKLRANRRIGWQVNDTIMLVR